MVFEWKSLFSGMPVRASTPDLEWWNFALEYRQWRVLMERELESSATLLVAIAGIRPSWHKEDKGICSANLLIQFSSGAEGTQR